MSAPGETKPSVVSNGSEDSVRVWLSERVRDCDQCHSNEANSTMSLLRCGHLVCAGCARGLSSCVPCDVASQSSELLSVSLSSASSSSRTRSALAQIDALVTRRALAPDLASDDASALLAHAQRLAHSVRQGRDPSSALSAASATANSALPAFEDSLHALRRMAHAEFKRVQNRKRAREDLSDSRAHARLDAHTAHTTMRALDVDAHTRAESLEAHALAVLARTPSLPVSSATATSASSNAQSQGQAVKTSYAPTEPRAQPSEQRLPQPLASAPPKSTGASDSALEERRRVGGGFDVALAATRARFEAWDALGIAR